jgi:hypothetical protein
VKEGYHGSSNITLQSKALIRPMKGGVHMRKSFVFCLAAAFALAICAGPAFAAVEWPDKFLPSKRGAGDEKGSFNTLTPEKVNSS